MDGRISCQYATLDTDQDTVPLPSVRTGGGNGGGSGLCGGGGRKKFEKG